MYMNLLPVFLPQYELCEGRDDSYSYLYSPVGMGSTSLVNSSVDLRFLLKSFFGHFVWWVLETSRMCQCLNLRQISSIIFKVHNVKLFMSSVVQKNIKLEMVRRISCAKGA